VSLSNDANTLWSNRCEPVLGEAEEILGATLPRTNWSFVGPERALGERMTVAGTSPERIGGEMQQEISSMLAGELKDPRLEVVGVSTEVRVSPNLKQARVYVNVSGDETERASGRLKGLETAAPHSSRIVRAAADAAHAGVAFRAGSVPKSNGQRIDNLLRKRRNTGLTQRRGPRS